MLLGSERGKRGKIIEVVRHKNRVIVEGVKLVKRHVKKNQAQPEGAIAEREGSVHISNVMLASTFDARVSRRTSAGAS